jgi:hypothetical protein
VRKEIIFYIFIAFFLILTLFFCPLWKESNQKKIRGASDNLIQENYINWIRLKKAFPVKQHSVELHQKFYFPRSDEVKNEPLLTFPLYLCSDSLGSIYVSDHLGHSIFKYNSRGQFLLKIGKSGQGPGEFLKPGLICTDKKDNLFVLDTGNKRIQIFNEKGNYIKSINLFKGYSGMAVNDEGFIFLSPYSTDIDAPLLEVISDDGLIYHSFGKRISFSHTTFAHNEVILSINSSDCLFVAWRYFPILRRYTFGGDLLDEQHIKYSLLEELAKSNYKMKIINKKIKTRDVVIGFKATFDKYYLLLIHPRIEILEFDLNGLLTNIFWSDRPYEFLTNDFIVLNDKDMQHPIFYILNIYPINGVSFYSSH